MAPLVHMMKSKKLAKPLWVVLNCLGSIICLQQWLSLDVDIVGKWGRAAQNRPNEHVEGVSEEQNKTKQNYVLVGRSCDLESLWVTILWFPTDNVALTVLALWHAIRKRKFYWPLSYFFHLLALCKLTMSLKHCLKHCVYSTHWVCHCTLVSRSQTTISENGWQLIHFNCSLIQLVVPEPEDSLIACNVEIGVL